MSYLVVSSIWRTGSWIFFCTILTIGNVFRKAIDESYLFDVK